MQDKKEIKIAIVVGIIMITICLVAFVTTKSKNNLNEVELKVYKLFETTDDEGKTNYHYSKCNIEDTDIEINIYRETVKALKLPEEKLITGKQIKGKYKVELNGKMIAFDGDENENFVFLNDTNRLYEFESGIYETVKKVCK